MTYVEIKNKLAPLFIKVMKDPTVKKVVQANTIDLLGAGSRLGANRFK